MADGQTNQTGDRAGSAQGADARITPTYAPPAKLVSAKIQEVGYSTVGIMILVIQSSAPVSGDYRAEVDGIDYQCVFQPEHPNNLYCSGPMPEHATHIRVIVYPAGGDTTLFTSEVSIPKGGLIKDEG